MVTGRVAWFVSVHGSFGSSVRSGPPGGATFRLVVNGSNNEAKK